MGYWAFARGAGGSHRGRPVQFVFYGGLGSGNSLHTILPSPSTKDSFLVILGLEGQVISLLSSTQGEAYDGWYGFLRGGAPPGIALRQVRRPKLPRNVWGPSRFGRGWVRRRSELRNEDKGGHRAAQREQLVALHSASHVKKGGGSVSMAPTIRGPGYVGGGHCSGAQGQFPDHFCLKTECHFTMHATKSYLPKIVAGGYYVKQNNTHSYSELCLSPEAAALAPEGLLQAPNSVAAWKFIIWQLEDQLSEGATEPDVVAAQPAGLAEFALRVLKTPYNTTPCQAATARVSRGSTSVQPTGWR